MFHVKHSFADTKITKDNIEQILDIKTPGNAAQRLHRQTQILGKQLRQDRSLRPHQRCLTFQHCLAVAGAGDHRPSVPAHRSVTTSLKRSSKASIPAPVRTDTWARPRPPIGTFLSATPKSHLLATVNVTGDR